MTLPTRVAQWWKLIQAAATRFAIDPYTLAAIMDRESNGGLTLEPAGPSGTGDFGHGRGLMQIDDRSHAVFCALKLADGRFAWEDPPHNIEEGASIFAACLKIFRAHPDVPDAEIAAIAAYNAGPHAVAQALNQITTPYDIIAMVPALDPITEEGNYVSDVLQRRSRFMQGSVPPLPQEPQT